MSQILVTGEAKIRDIQGPVVSNSGVITALDGDASQYVRGDGTLADFPTSTGGGSSVSYYLNSSVSQGTIGGVAYRQLSKTPISGAGTDIAISTTGYVASYITDANDPALLEVPAGNFNCEFYFSVNSNSHNPYVYAELYKYDGTTFTLLGSNVAIPEYLTNGTTLSAYYFAIPVAVAALTITDRLAIRIYVNVDGRTVTLHTENSHLCQVVTTFSKGLISLNNLTRQNQFFGTGTSGTDFGIVSSVATHTFNLPVASAANTGKLSSTDWSTFNGKVPYTGANANVDLGSFSLTSLSVTANSFYAQGNGTQGGYLYLKQGIVPYGTLTGANSISANGTKYIFFSDAGSSNAKIALFELGSLTNNTERTFTLPDASGTLALLESTQTFSGVNTFTSLNMFDASINYKTGGSIVNTSGYIAQGYDKTGTGSGSTLSLKISDGNSVKAINLDFVGSPATYTYTFPAASGTISLLESTQTFTGVNTFSGLTSFTFSSGTRMDYGPYLTKGSVPTVFSGSTTNIYSDVTTNNIVIRDTSSSAKLLFDNSTQTYTFPAATGTLALTSNLSAYLPLAGGTLTGALSGTSATFSSTLGVTGAATFSDDVSLANSKSLRLLGGSLRILNSSGSATYGYFISNNAWKGSGNNNPSIAADSGLGINFFTNGSTTEAMTITSGGNLGIGTTSPGAKLHVSSGYGLVNNGYSWAVYNSSSSGFAAQFGAADDVAFANGGNNAIVAAMGSNAILFGTNSSERMRITSGGYTKMSNDGTYINATGTYHELRTTTTNNEIVVLRNTSASPYGLTMQFNTASPNNATNWLMYLEDSTAQRFSVRSNGGIYNYQANDVNLSDERTKKDIIPLESYWNKFKAIEIVKFKYKDQSHDDFNIGVIAQQVEKVAPEFIDIDGWDNKPELDEDGNEIVSDEEPLKSVYTSDLHHATIKVLQEAMTKIEQLEARIKQLENK